MVIEYDMLLYFLLAVTSVPSQMAATQSVWCYLLNEIGYDLDVVELFMAGSEH